MFGQIKQLTKLADILCERKGIRLKKKKIFGKLAIIVFLLAGVLHYSIDAYAAEHYMGYYIGSKAPLSVDDEVKMGDYIFVKDSAESMTINGKKIREKYTPVGHPEFGELTGWKADKDYIVKKIEENELGYSIFLEEMTLPTPTPPPSTGDNLPSTDDASDAASSYEKNESVITSTDDASDAASSDERNEPVITSTDLFRSFLEDMGQQVLDAPENGNVRIETDTWLCFDRKTFETLKERTDVSLTVEYRYEKKYYTLTIPAGYDVETLLDENGYAGFRWVDQFVGGHEIEK